MTRGGEPLMGCFGFSLNLYSEPRRIGSPGRKVQVIQPLPAWNCFQSCVEVYVELQAEIEARMDKWTGIAICKLSLDS